MTRNRKDRLKEQGFTLIEIVAVLVILGILAAVAVPKYFDMQESAGLQAAKATAAEVQARVNQVFAQKLLEGYSIDAVGSTPAVMGCAAARTFATTSTNILEADSKIGDWTVTLGAVTNDAMTIALANTSIGINVAAADLPTIKVPVCD